MKQTAIFPGRYVQAEGAIEALGEEVQRLGTSALIVAGRTAEGTLVPRHLPAWRERLAVTVERFGGESSEEEIERLTKVAEAHACDVIAGMGGGKVIDTAKAVTHAANARVAIVPTIASTDAPTSAVAVIYTSDGAFLRYLFLPRNPDLVLVDTRVIAAAPVRFLVAGMGDALATWFEAESCRLAYAPNQCGGVGTLAGVSDDDLRKVAEAACGAEETIHHEPCPVSVDAVTAALKIADRFGHERRDRRHLPP